MSSTSLIGIDWGTSSLRVYDLTTATPVELCATPMGIKRFDGHHGYAAYLDGLLAELAIDPAAIIASGMITSQQGWFETSYRSTPVSAPELAAAAISHEVGDRTIWVLPGVRHYTDAGVDVMRGEETQIMGVAAPEELFSGTVLLPGTHSKWATVSDATIVEFATFVTGELFELVSQHSIIGAVIDGNEPDQDAFDRGVHIGLDRRATAGGLLNSLFSVRTEGLLNPAKRSGLHSYLSGLLIGSEIAGASRGRDDDSQPVLVVGDGDLVASYRHGLELAGIAAASAPSHTAGLGLKHIAQLIGIL